MTEKTDEKLMEEYAEQSANRIANMARMVYEYQKVLNNDSLNSLETMQIGMDCIQAGLLIIKKSCDMDSLNVQERLQVNTDVLNAITSIINSVYLDEDILCKMVAAVMENDVKKAASTDFKK